MESEIPIWMEGKQLLLTGIDRRTTVDDVIETIIGQVDKSYSMVEKWRRVERPLNGDTKILKLWKAWGEERGDIKLSIKKIYTENDSGRGSPSSCGKRRHRTKSNNKHHGQTIHPRRLAQLSKTQNIEKLIELILEQGETIRNQLSNLKTRQHEIENYEGKQRNRISANYILETYLGNECDDKEDSGMATESVPSSENTATPTGEESKEDDEENTLDEHVENEIQKVQTKIGLLEKIVKINKKIEKQEENLVKLYINIERCKKSDQVMRDLGLSLVQLQTQSEKSQIELQQNSNIITDVEETLHSRKQYLQDLQAELDKSLNNVTEEIPFKSSKSKYILDTLV